MSPASHGVVVIHGIGDNQSRGDILARVTNGLADSLQESGGSVDREMDIASDPASASLRIAAPDGRRHHWIFKEAFWAEAFPAPHASTVLRWLIRQQASRLRYIWYGWFRDPANNERFRPDHEQSRQDRVWSSGWFLTAMYRIQLFIIGVVMVPLSFALPLIFIILWPLYWLPRVGPLDSVLRWIHSLDPFLSRSLGDTQRYIEDGMWSASARGVLEGIVISMLNDEYGEVEDITIVAHSMGCVVTYDALGGGSRIAREVARLEAEGKQKKITFVSVGSGINGSFHLAWDSNLYARERFTRPLAPEITGYDPTRKQSVQELQSRFFWIDLYSRFDPVPAGDLDREIEIQARIHPDQLKRRRVVNLDNPLRDHSYYWLNKDLVMPRIARAINGGTDYPWPEAGVTEEKVRFHINGVAVLVALRLSLVSAVLANVGFLFWHPDWRPEVLERVETVVVRLPAVDSFYCQASNGALHSSVYEELTMNPWRELSAADREARIQDMGLTPGMSEMECLLQTNFLKRDLGEFAMTLILAAITALAGVGLYQAIRSWKFGALS